jgi:hypothetical protein
MCRTALLLQAVPALPFKLLPFCNQCDTIRLLFPAGPSASTSTSKSPFQSATKTRTADTNVSNGDQRQRSIALVNEGLEVRSQQQQEQ